MRLARALVQGVDVWLNTPTRMLEASGTSGMKAAANGGLNLSIADGWWPEAYDGSNGWVIGGDEGLRGPGPAGRARRARVLHRLLEEEIVPLYFDRDEDGLPRGWVERMIRVLATIPPVFNTDRMVEEYFDTAYRKLALAGHRHGLDRRALAKERAREAKRIRSGFAGVKVLEAHLADLQEIQVGESIDAHLDVDLGVLTPPGRPRRARARPLRVPTVCATCAPSTSRRWRRTDGAVRFEGSHRIEGSGRYVHGLRVRARHEELAGGPLRDLVFWV